MRDAAKGVQFLEKVIVIVADTEACLELGGVERDLLDACKFERCPIWGIDVADLQLNRLA